MGAGEAEEDRVQDRVPAAAETAGPVETAARAEGEADMEMVGGAGAAEGAAAAVVMPTPRPPPVGEVAAGHPPPLGAEGRRRLEVEQAAGGAREDEGHLLQRARGGEDVPDKKVAPHAPAVAAATMATATTFRGTFVRGVGGVGAPAGGEPVPAGDVPALAEEGTGPTKGALNAAAAITGPTTVPRDDTLYHKP